MEFRKDISKFITQICEKNYSSANSTLETLIEKKLKGRVKKMHNDCCDKCEKKKKKVVKENLGRLDGISDGGSPYEEAELDDMEPFEPFEEPEEEDYIISNSGTLGSRTSVSIFGGKHLATFGDEEDAENFLRKRMDQESFYPKVWFADDHGDYTLRKL